MRKIAVVLIAAIVGAVLTGVIASAGSRISSPTQIETVEANKVQHTFDNGKSGFSIGDVIHVSDYLDDPATGVKIAHMHEVCTAVHTKNVSLECIGTAELADGQISVMGEFPPVDAEASYSIIGGTGAYENVGGKMTVSASPNEPLRLTFFLVP